MKRIFDLTFSLIALMTCLPLFVIVAILIKLDSPGPVFFRQERIGKNFSPFRINKFRTMTLNASDGDTLITVGGDRRITKTGRLLRKTKIDELPQLINVFKGEMSFVGPRPEVAKYVEMFRDEYSEILKVKPGITDYATLKFRDEEGILRKYDNPQDGYIKEVLPEKIELYKKYLKEKGFLTDIKLIFFAIRRIIQK